MEASHELSVCFCPNGPGHAPLSGARPASGYGKVDSPLDQSLTSDLGDTPNDIRKTPVEAAPQVAEASRRAGEVQWLPASGQTLSR